MTGKYTRPVGAYEGMAGLANAGKYRDDAAAVPKRAISSSKMDGDFNYIIESLNKIDEASGSEASIAERLDASLNADGTLKGSVVATVDDWVAHTNCGTLARVDDATFSMAGGDFTGLYVEGRRVRIMIGVAYYYGDVAAVAFAGGLTSVTLAGLVDSAGSAAVVSAAPAGVAYGFMSPGATGTLVRRFADGVTVPAGSSDFRVAGDAGELVILRDGVDVARFGASGLVGQEIADIGLAQLASETTARLVPSGAVMPFAGAAAPGGWLMCDGSAVSRSTYGDLFLAIGTLYGAGDGSTTFNLPDMRGRAVFGADAMGGSAASRVTSAVCGIDGSALGAAGGDQRMPAHGHTASVSDPGHTHLQSFGNSSGGLVYNPPGSGAGGWGATGIRTQSSTTGIGVTVASSGDGTAANMPPAMMLNYVIKA